MIASTPAPSRGVHPARCDERHECHAGHEYDARHECRGSGPEDWVAEVVRGAVGDVAVDLRALISAAVTITARALLDHAARLRGASIEDLDRLLAACERLTRIEAGLGRVEWVDEEGRVAEGTPTPKAVASLLRDRFDVSERAPEYDIAHNVD